MTLRELVSLLGAHADEQVTIDIRVGGMPFSSVVEEVADPPEPEPKKVEKMERAKAREKVSPAAEPPLEKPKKKDAPVARGGQGRKRSPKSIEREKWIRALHTKRGDKLTRIKAAEMVEKKFDCTNAAARSAVYALTDLKWGKKKAASEKQSADQKREEAEAAFAANEVEDVIPEAPEAEKVDDDQDQKEPVADDEDSDDELGDDEDSEEEELDLADYVM